MKVALIGDGYLAYATLVRLLALGCDHVVVSPLDAASGDTSQVTSHLVPLRAHYPDATIEQVAEWPLGHRYNGAKIEACALALDSAASNHHVIANERAIESGVRFVPAIGMGEVAHVGPVVGTPNGPCLHCIEMRVQASRGQSAIVGPYPAQTDVVARAGNLTAELAVGCSDLDGDAVHYVWNNGGQTTSFALRVGSCPACANVAPAPAFATSQQPALASGPAADKRRIRDIERHIVDPVMGVVRSVQHYAASTTEPQIAHAVASIADPVWASYGQELNGGGNDADAESAYAASLGEALDRVATTQPAAEHLVVASYDDVRDHAIDPSLFDTFDKRTRDLPGFPFREITNETPLSWVWGWSHARKESVLVPASRVFVPMSSTVEGDGQHHTNVTGSATGSSRIDAALGGLLEVTERDMFMIMWANQLPVTGVTIDASDESPAAFYARSFADVGIEVRVCYLTLDWGVPLAIALAKSPHAGDPAVVMAAAAEPDLADACASALKELTANLAFVRPLVAGSASLPSADPAQVRDQHAHAMLYARPEMAEHLAHWWNPARSIPLPAATEEAAHLTYERIADAAVASGADVIAVDVSLPGLGERGMFTYKIVAPGAYPMNFDSLWPEWGGQRMLHAPVAAGLYDTPHDVSQLCPTPHPFP